jgi:hypothetical protein
MIREMKHGEEDKARTILAKLDYEDQVFHRLKSNSCLRLGSPRQRTSHGVLQECRLQGGRPVVMAFITS